MNTNVERSIYKSNLCQGKISILIGIELLEKFPPLGLVLICPLEGQLGVDLIPIDGSHCRVSRIDLQVKIELEFLA